VSKSLSSRGILIASFLVVCVVISFPSATAAELKLSRMVWDFESVEQGESNTQKIVLTNSGDQPLKIDRIDLPEGCSVKPDLADKEIEAKGELEVEFTFDSQKMLGKLQQYAYIFLSDSSIVPLTIKGEVFAKAQPRLQVTPTTWDFGTVKVAESRQMTFRCKNTGTGELNIEKVQIYDPRFRVTRNITKETLAGGEEVDFAVSVNPEYAGKCDTDFYVKSNSAGRKYTKVSAKGYAVSKTIGIVVSRDFSFVTNNTPHKVGVTRTDNLGKEETLTLDKDSRKSFPRKPGPQRTNPENYTLTIKLLKPSPPTPKPAEPKASAEKPSPPAPKPETKPAEEKPEEETAAPEKAEKKEEKKPGEQKEEKQAAPSGKEEPEKPPQESPAKPDEKKPSEGEAPRKEEAPSAKPEKTEPSEGSGKRKETPPEGPKAEKEPAATPEKEDTEKPPEGTEKEQSSQKPASPPSAKPEGPSGSPEAPKKPSDEAPSANK